MSEPAFRKSKVLHPAAEAWMLADVLPDGRIDPASAVAAALPHVPASGERLTVALPAGVFASALVPVTAPDEATRDAALALQLEKLGLQQPGNPVPTASCEAGALGDERTMLAVLLDDQPPAGVCIESAERFEPAPRLVDTAPGALSLYRELGRLVAVAPSATGGMAHFQLLGSERLDAEAASELALLLQSIPAMPGLPPVAKIHVHFEATTAELQTLADATGLEASTTGAPSRRLPEPAWNLTPPRVLALRAASARRRIIRLAAAAGLVLLLGMVGLMAFNHVSLAARASGLRADLARVEADVSSAQAAAARWQEMRLAMEPALFPIERLYQAARLLPAEGVRLTVFEQRGGSIVISGEASSTPAAIKFANDLKRSPEWGGYTFEIPQPKILPNNSAQFRVTARAPGTVGEPTDAMP